MDSEIFLRKFKKDGDLSQIVSHAKVILSVPGSLSVAQKTIKMISSLCSEGREKRESPSVGEEDVLNVALMCCEAIYSDLQESVKKIESPTIYSFYKVLRHLLTNGNISSTVKLFTCLLPILEKMTISDEDRKTIMSSLLCLFLDLLNSLVTKPPTTDLQHSFDSFLLELWDLTMRLSSLAKVNSVIHVIVSRMTKLAVYFKKYHHPKDEKEQISFCTCILDKFIKFCKSNYVLSICSDGLEDHFLIQAIKAFWQFVDIGLPKRQTLLSLSECVAVFVPPSSDHMESFSLISRVAQVLVIDEEFDSNEKTVVKELHSFINILKKFEMEELPTAYKWAVFSIGNFMKCMNIKKAAEFESFRTKAVLSAMQKFSYLTAKLLSSCNINNCVSATGQTCPCTSDAVHAFCTAETFIRMCIFCKKDKADWVEVWPMVQDSLQLQNSLVSQACGEQCFKGQQIRKRLYDYYYNVGVLWYKFDDWSQSVSYLSPALQYFYETLEAENGSHHQRLLSVSSKLCVCFEKLGMKMKAQAVILLHVTLQIQLNTTQDHTFSEKWSSLQTENLEKRMTAGEFLRLQLPLLKLLCPSFSFDEKLLPILLLWELSCYVAHRTSCSDAILNAWTNLKSLNPSPLMILQGFAQACQALFYSKDSVDWAELLSVPLKSLLSKVEPPEKGVALCSVALFYHVKFLILCQKHFDQSGAMVLEGTVYPSNPKTVKLPGDVVDPSDVCDVRSSFQNLNLNQEQELMACLDTAVNHWDDSLKAGLTRSEYDSTPVVNNSGDYLLQAAFLFALWGDQAGAAKTYLVCSKFARQMQRDDLLLQALSGLMNYVKMEDKLIEEADALYLHLKAHPNFAYLQKVYCTSRAFQALRRNEYEMGLRALKEVINFTPSNATVWCLSYAKLLQASFGLLPDYLVDKSELGESGVHSAHHGLSYSSQTVKKKRLFQSPLAFAAMGHQALSLSLWIGRYYLRCKMPREARCCLKAELSLALKLGLATRAVEFICELAFVDLVTENVDAVSTKLLDIESILMKDDNLSHNFSDSEMEGEECVNDRKFLAPAIPDIGQSPDMRQNQEFYIPFSHHEPSCQCYTCRNYSIQNIWLMYNHLLAKVSMFQSRVKDSSKIYVRTLKVAGSILQNINQDIRVPGCLLQQHEVACTVVTLRLDFVDLLVIYKKDKEAWKRCQGTIELLYDLKTHEPQLLAEALEQKICLVKVIETDREFLNFKEVKVNQIKEGRSPLKSLKVSTPNTDSQFLTPKYSRNIRDFNGIDGKSSTPLKKCQLPWKSGGGTDTSTSLAVKDKIPKGGDSTQENESKKSNVKAVSKIPHLKITETKSKPSSKINKTEVVSQNLVAPLKVRNTRQAPRSNPTDSVSMKGTKPSKPDLKETNVNVDSIPKRQSSRKAQRCSNK